MSSAFVPWWNVPNESKIVGYHIALLGGSSNLKWRWNLLMCKSVLVSWFVEGQGLDNITKSGPGPIDTGSGEGSIWEKSFPKSPMFHRGTSDSSNLDLLQRETLIEPEI